MRVPPKEKWYCPECDSEVSLFVRTTQAPVCQNLDKHPTLAVTMERDDLTEEFEE